MTRFSGKIGINQGPVEDPPGVYTILVKDVEVIGRMQGNKLVWPKTGMQESLRTNHVLSIIAPEDSYIDFTEVVYVVWKGRKWSVISIEFKRPRVDLMLGGLYNG